MSRNPDAAIVLTLAIEPCPLAAPFSIAGRTFTERPVLVVSLRKRGVIGRGEAVGVHYLNDLPESMVAQLEAVRPQIEAGIDRVALQRLLPPGGARNAVDSALWDLEAKLSGLPAWRAAGLEPPKRLLTTFTLGVDEPARMAAGALDYAQARALKLKLSGDGLDADRVRAVRAVRPDVWMGVDANQGFTRELLIDLLPVLVEADVGLIEQPFALGRDADLDGIVSPIPMAADESLQSIDDVEALVGRYQVLNIKLDKCGGLTEGLAIARKARELGLKVMVGNMIGTSLSLGPAFVLGQLCDIVDLDGPIFLKFDPPPAALYEDGYVWCPEAVWGHGEPALAGAAD